MMYKNFDNSLKLLKKKLSVFVSKPQYHDAYHVSYHVNTFENVDVTVL